jgi:hypothetical protein
MMISPSLGKQSFHATHATQETLSLKISKKAKEIKKFIRIEFKRFILALLRPGAPLPRNVPPLTGKPP